MNNIVSKVTTAIFENSRTNKLRVSLESSFNTFDEQAKDLIIYGEKSRTLYAQSQMFLKFEWLSDTGVFTDNRKILLSAYSFINLKSIFNEITLALTNSDLFIYGNANRISNVNQNCKTRFELNNIGRKNRSLVFYITADSINPGEPITPLILIEFLPEREGQGSVYSVLTLDDFNIIKDSLANLDFVGAQLNHVNTKLLYDLGDTISATQQQVINMAGTNGGYSQNGYTPRSNIQQGGSLPTYKPSGYGPKTSSSYNPNGYQPKQPNYQPSQATIIPPAFGAQKVAQPVPTPQTFPTPQGATAGPIAPSAPVPKVVTTDNENDLVNSLVEDLQ